MGMAASSWAPPSDTTADLAGLREEIAGLARRLGEMETRRATES